MHILHLELAPNVRDSFLLALAGEGIAVDESENFSTDKKTSISIHSINDYFPWSALAKVVIAWIQRHDNKRIEFIDANGDRTCINGHSAKESIQIIEAKKPIALIVHDN